MEEIPPIGSRVRYLSSVGIVRGMTEKGRVIVDFGGRVGRVLPRTLKPAGNYRPRRDRLLSAEPMPCSAALPEPAHDH